MRRGASAKPWASVTARSRSSAGHGRSGLTWSAVTGDTPPQSSMPASSSGPEVVGQVGRDLQVHVRRAARGGPRPRSRAAPRAGRPASRCIAGARLGQEVLDDDLLHVAVAAVRGGDGLERLQPVGPGLADAHQDPGGERDGQLAGRLQGGQPAGGLLVGRAAVAVQVGRGATRSSSPARATPPAAAASSSGEEGAGVGVGEQARSRRAPARPWPPGSRRWRRSRARPARRPATG